MTDDEVQHTTGDDQATNADAGPITREPAGGAPEPDLAELETRIRAQLKELITAAKQCRDRATDVLQRAAPFQVVRESLTKVIEGEHQHVQTLHDEHQLVVDERVARIEEVSANLAREVELRREAREAEQQAWNSLQQTNGAAAERWFRAIRERRTDLQGELGDFHEWLTAAEQRWGEAEPTETDDV